MISHTTSGCPDEAITADGEPLTFGAWWMVFILFCFLILSHVDRTIAAHLVEPIKTDLSLTDFHISLILGPAFAFTFSFAAMPAGWLADRFDRRLLLAVGVLVWSLATMGCGLMGSAIGLIVMRMIVALGEATLHPAAVAMIGDRFPPSRRTAALASFQAGSKVGTSVAYFSAAGALVLATTLVARYHDMLGLVTWQIVFILVGLPGVFLAPLLLTFKKVPRRIHAVTPSYVPVDSLVLFLRQHRRIFVPLFTGFILIAIPAGALTTWLPTFMVRHFGWTAAEYGPPLGTITLVAAICAVPLGMLADWLFRRGMRDAPLRFLTWLLTISLPVAAFIFFSGPAIFLGLMAFLQIVALGYPLYVTATMQLVTPNHLRGRITGFMVAIVPFFSQGIGPMIIGALTEFVFEDPNKIGAALTIVVFGGMTLGLIMLRIGLSRLGPLLPPSGSLKRAVDAA